MKILIDDDGDMGLADRKHGDKCTIYLTPAEIEQLVAFWEEHKQSRAFLEAQIDQLQKQLNSLPY